MGLFFFVVCCFFICSFATEEHKRAAQLKEEARVLNLKGITVAVQGDRMKDDIYFEAELSSS